MLKSKGILFRLNKPDFALITLEKGTLKCYDSQRTDVQKELAQLRKDFKQLKNIKQKNWQKADIKELGKDFIYVHFKKCHCSTIF